MARNVPNNSYIAQTHRDPVDGESLTVWCWVRVPTLSVRRIWTNRDTGGNDHGNIGINSSSGDITVSHNAGTAMARRTNTGAIAAATWCCLVVVFRNGTTPLIFFGDADTAMSESYAVPGTGAGNLEGSVDTPQVRWGNSGNLSNDLVGDLAQVAMTSWAATLAEAERYRQGDLTVLYDHGQPNGHLPLDSPTASVMVDLSGAGRDGSAAGTGSAPTVVEEPTVPFAWASGAGAWPVLAAGGGGGGTTVTPDDLDVATTLTSPTVTQLHQVDPADLAIATTLTSPTVTQVHEVAPADLTVATVLTSPTIGQLHEVAPNDMAVATALTSSTVVQQHDVAPNDLSVAATLTSPTLVQHHQVQPDDLHVATTITSPTLQQDGTIAPEALLVATTITSPTITQDHQIAPGDLTVTAALTAPTVVQHHAVDPADLTVTSTLTSPTVTVGDSLAPADLTVAIVLTSPAITQRHDVTPTPLLVATTLTSPTLTGGQPPPVPGTRTFRVPAESRTVIARRDTRRAAA